MVRSPSGVTMMKERAVAGPDLRRRGREIDAEGADVLREDLAERVVPHLADEGRAPAEGGDARRRVGGAAARDDLRRPHGGVERFGARLVDQRHRALGEVVRDEEIVLAHGRSRRRWHCRGRVRRSFYRSSSVHMWEISGAKAAGRRAISHSRRFRVKCETGRREGARSCGTWVTPLRPSSGAKRPNAQDERSRAAKPRPRLLEADDEGAKIRHGEP